MLIGVILIVVAIVYIVACLVVGFGPPGTLASFHASVPGPDRRFVHPPAQVASAYRAAAAATAGMSIADESTNPTTLLIDSRPTSRILGGDFGMVVRFCFEFSNGTTVVSTDARSKVPFALVNHEAALVHVERAVRQRAKSSGLDEQIVAAHG